MNARQDWEKRTLVLKPPGQKLGEVIVYNMKSGRQQCLEVETSEESESSFGSTLSTGEETSQDSSECDSSLKVTAILTSLLTNRQSAIENRLTFL